MYINSINNNGTDYTLSSFGNIIVCSNGINDVKTVTFPNGFVNTNPEPYLTFQVLFVNGHNCVDSTTYMTLNDYNIMVNKNGSLINLPIHKFTESSNVVYKSLQANTILNLFFDGTQFVVIGNPIVLSSTDYTIYANGKVGDGNVGDIKAISSENIPYGWLLCDGREVSRTEYSALFNIIGTKFGNGDKINTFNVPDLKGRFLQGANENLGTVKEAGLPNIVGDFEAQSTHHKSVGSNSNSSPLFKVARLGTVDDGTSKASDYQSIVTFDASQVNSIYGKSDTVQPPAVCVNYIIKY